MTDTPPVRLPGHGALLPDGTYVPEDQCQAAVERYLDFIDMLLAEGQELPS